MNGPRQGSVYVLQGRTVIGRAGHADIQLVNSTVSRQHAKLVVDDAGHVTLTDLASDNGTYVNGESVQRRALQPGDTICVADTRFLLEDAAGPAQSSSVFRAKVQSLDAMRQTAPHKVVVRPGARKVGQAGVGEYATQDRQREALREEPVEDPGSGKIIDPTAASRPLLDEIDDPELASGLDAHAFEQVGPALEIPALEGGGNPWERRRASVPQEPARPAPSSSARPGWPTAAAQLSGAPRDPRALLEPSRPDPRARPAYGETFSSLPPTPAPADDDSFHPFDDPFDPPLRERPLSSPGGGGRKRVTAEYAAPLDAPSLDLEPLDDDSSPRDRASPRRKHSTSEYGITDDWMVESNPDEDVMPVPAEVVGVDLLCDIVAYRELRLRMLRGPTLDANDRAKFRNLERRLERAPEEGEELSLQRRFHRFECVLRAWVHVGSPDGPYGPARVVDISAGGAQVLLGGARISPGDTMWLRVELVGPDAPGGLGANPPPEILECRVVWASPRGARVGVIFAGRSRGR